jgi:hypothetical protein
MSEVRESDVRTFRRSPKTRGRSNLIETWSKLDRSLVETWSKLEHSLVNIKLKNTSGSSSVFILVNEAVFRYNM